jgi:hypothetical protein
VTLKVSVRPKPLLSKRPSNIFCSSRVRLQNSEHGAHGHWEAQTASIQSKDRTKEGDRRGLAFNLTRKNENFSSRRLDVRSGD